MKKLFAIFMLATVAVVASCSKEDNDLSQGKTVKMSINASFDEEPESRVIFSSRSGDKYSLIWNQSSETLRIYERTDNATWNARTTTDVGNISSDRKTAHFTATIDAKSGSTFDYWLAYPGSVNNYGITYDDNHDNWLNIVRMGTNITPQVPMATSVDNRYVFLIAAKKGLSSQATSLDAEFVPISSYGKMTVTGLDAASVSNIRITFNSKSYVTGFIDYRVDTETPTLTKSSSWSKNYIDINPKNISINSTSFDVWFGIAVTTVEVGESMTITFTTPSGDIEKTFTIPTGKALNFQRGHVVGFTVDMAGLLPVVPAKQLTFDFSSTDTSKIPVEAKTASTIGDLATFEWQADDGNSYGFTNLGGFYHRENQAFAQLAPTNHGYLGLPVISGWKLTKVGFVRLYSGERQLEITSAAPKSDDSESLTGTVIWNSASPADISLSNTTAGTRYYIHALNSTYTDIVKIILTYEQ